MWAAFAPSIKWTSRNAGPTYCAVCCTTIFLMWTAMRYCSEINNKKWAQFGKTVHWPFSGALYIPWDGVQGIIQGPRKCQAWEVTHPISAPCNSEGLPSRTAAPCRLFSSPLHFIEWECTSILMEYFIEATLSKTGENDRAPFLGHTLNWTQLIEHKWKRTTSFATSATIQLPKQWPVVVERQWGSLRMRLFGRSGGSGVNLKRLDNVHMQPFNIQKSLTISLLHEYY